MNTSWYWDIITNFKEAVIHWRKTVEQQIVRKELLSDNIKTINAQASRCDKRFGGAFQYCTAKNI